MNPEDWKDLARVGWAALAVPIGYVWKKANGAVQKEDFKDAMREMTDELKEHSRNDRETFNKLFEKLEQQDDTLADIKEAAARVETTLHFIKPQR